jgi:hypothetical protein
MPGSVVTILQQCKRTIEEFLVQSTLPSDLNASFVSLPDQLQIAITQSDEISATLSSISSLTSQYTPVFEAVISSQAKLQVKAGLSLETLTKVGEEIAKGNSVESDCNRFIALNWSSELFVKVTQVAREFFGLERELKHIQNPSDVELGGLQFFVKFPFMLELVAPHDEEEEVEAL